MGGGEVLDRSMGMVSRAQIVIMLVFGFEQGGCTRFVQAACAGRDRVGKLDLFGVLILEYCVRYGLVLRVDDIGLKIKITISMLYCLQHSVVQDLNRMDLLLYVP